MEGGIDAWHGMVAEGTPDAGRAYFSSAANPEEVVALSWLMEDGSRRFYSGVSGMLEDKELSKVFTNLTKAEEHHKSSVLDVYRAMTGLEPGPDFPASVFPDGADHDIMEGGMNVKKALNWAKGKSAIDSIELSIAMEINAYDLYIIMEREIQGKNAKKVFSVLAHEEKQHLERLNAVLEEKLRSI